ncbi:MAG: hypothetical protein ACI3WU_05530 [Phascolarctobacterium sp.]
MFGNEGKCFRKGGRRELESTYNPEAHASRPIPQKRAKQFAAFAALRGYEEMLEAARSDEETKEMP